LLDAHIARQVARVLRERGIDALALGEWHAGQYLDKSDEEILRAAHLEARTLVTYDVGSIPRLIERFSQAGIEHSGVILVSTKTRGPWEIAPLADSLQRFLSVQGDQDWRNLVLFLPK
jgi:hypothetical protein